MGRTKQYDRTQLLDRAVDLFRRRGFNGTSTADLVSALGVNRKSMYAEFGSKQGLFEATLEHYSDRYLGAALAPIEAEGAGLEGIRRAFGNYAAAAEGRARGLGCLLCNTAVDRGALPPGSERYVESYLDRLARAFHHALDNARRSAQLRPTTDLDELTAFFTMSLIGAAACVRAEASPATVRAACNVATRVLDAHGP